MKKILLSFIICFSLLTVQSCSSDNSTNDDKKMSDSDVPATVKAAFSAKYSTATDVKWEDAHEDTVKTYKAKFMLSGKKMKAEFDGAGSFVKEEEDN